MSLRDKVAKMAKKLDVSNGKVTDYVKNEDETTEEEVELDD